MKCNVTQKFNLSHLLEGTIGEAKEIGIKIDLTLTQDATGTLVMPDFESMNIPRVRQIGRLQSWIGARQIEMIVSGSLLNIVKKSGSDNAL